MMMIKVTWYVACVTGITFEFAELPVSPSSPHAVVMPLRIGRLPLLPLCIVL
jgi:hypothetical protein